jgi:acetyl-CoA C-acetyltransferase
MPPGSDRLDPRLPVLVGVGAASGDREATALMAEALRAAADDAGAPSVLAAIDRVAVPEGSWSYPDPGRLVATAVGAPTARTHRVELGIPQQTLINDACAAIRDGSSEVAVVVGGEAKRWARSPGAVATDQPGASPDVLQLRPGPVVAPVEVATRLWDPVQQYAMIDNALRAAEGQSVPEHRLRVSELWARFNRVARANPRAAFPTPMTAGEIDTPGPTNRPLAFPYNKWHSTQWTVDQAAALILCSVATARRLGVPTDRWVFPRVGLESTQAVSLLARGEPHRWPAMGVLGRAAAAWIGRPVAEAEVVEVYSCFPAAVRVQQRELGLDPEGTPTVTGGMAFAGGPFNNFVYQATAEVVARLRSHPGSLGLVTTVSGLLTKPGLAVWCTEPDARGPLLADLTPEATAATGQVAVVDSLDGYAGPATVVTYTVTPEGLEPAHTVVVGDTPDGRRCVAFSDDRGLAAHAEATELIGTEVTVGAGTFHPAGRREWERAKMR